MIKGVFGWILRLLCICLVIVSSNGQSRLCYTNECGIPSKMYCKKSLAASVGHCEPCWKCCLFPGIYGQCPVGCSCFPGKQCILFPDEPQCGDGLTCVRGYPNETQLGWGICKSKYNSSLSILDNYEQFSGKDIMNSRCILHPNDDASDLLVTRPGSFPSWDLIPSYLKNETGPGCPCAPWNVYLNNSSQSNILPCSAGYKCVRIPDSILSVVTTFDILAEPVLYTLNATCQPCMSGDYCPPGTMAQGGLPAAAPMLGQSENTNVCPPGFSCSFDDQQNQTKKTACPAGTFCPSGTSSPLSCSTLALLQSSRYIVKEVQPVTVVSAVISGDLPLAGNVCPVNSTDPTYLCPQGNYCPNTSLIIFCPKGHFCRSGSIAPTPCPWMSDCSTPGLDAPGSSWGCLIFSLITITICVLCEVLPSVIDNLVKRYRLKRFGLNGPQVQIQITSPVFACVSESDTTSRCINRESKRNTPGAVLKQLIIINASTSANSRAAGKGKYFLAPTSWCVLPCSLNAIMGSSGCGKSTLLELIRGNIPAYRLCTGLMKVSIRNSKHEETNFELDIEHDINALQGGNRLYLLKSICGHVPQDDVVLPELTVRENILFSMKLHCQGKNDHLDSRVDDVINQLSLTRVQHSRAGGHSGRTISGGQRKRTSIAMALATSPPVVVMDEPTSGLDSTSSHQLLCYCKELSKKLGTTFIMVLHQPRYTSFMVLDEVLLLSRQGAVFHGSPSLALAYIKYGLKFQIDINENPADSIMDLLDHPPIDSDNSLSQIWTCQGHVWAGEAEKTMPLLHNIITTDVTMLLSTQLLPLDIRKELSTILTLHGGPSSLDSVFEKINIFRDLFPPALTPATAPENVLYTELEDGYSICERGVLAVGFDLLCSNLHFANQSGCMLQGSNAPIHRLQCSIAIKINGFLWQCILLCLRRVISVWRSAWFIQVILPMIVGIVTGLIQGSYWTPQEFARNIGAAMASLGVLSCVTHVRTFPLDWAMIVRDLDRNVSVLQYSMAYMVTDMVWVAVMPLVFCVPYTLIIAPHVDVIEMYIAGFWVCWWCSGAAYLISILPVALHWLNLISVFVSVLFGALLNGLNPSIQESQGDVAGVVMAAGYNRWVLETIVVREFAYITETSLAKVSQVLASVGYCPERFSEHDRMFVLEQWVLSALSGLNRYQKNTRLEDKNTWPIINLREECSASLYKATLMCVLLGCGFRVVHVVFLHVSINLPIQRLTWNTVQSLARLCRFMGK